MDIVPRTAGKISLNRASLRSGESRIPQQLVITFLLGFVAPLALFVVSRSAGRDVGTLAYLVVLAAVILDIVLMSLTGIVAWRASGPPESPEREYPLASAIILTNASTDPAALEQTKSALSTIQYSQPVQVIVTTGILNQAQAFAHLGDDMEADPATPHGHGDESVEQIRAALPQITGEFVAIFHAGQIPTPDVFTRAWLWLSHGCGAVQGSCLVSDAGRNWVTRLAALQRVLVELLPCPLIAPWGDMPLGWQGNMYLRTEYLRDLLGDGDPNAERPAGGGYARDRLLIAHQPGPQTLDVLWTQQLHQELALIPLSAIRIWQRSRRFSANRDWSIPLIYRLVWRSAYVWLSLQVLTVTAYLIWSRGSVLGAGWIVPLLVLLALAGFGDATVRTLFAFLLSPPELKEHRDWFYQYFLISASFYQGTLHTIARLSQLLALDGEGLTRVPAQANRNQIPVSGSLTTGNGARHSFDSLPPLPEEPENAGLAGNPFPPPFVPIVPRRAVEANGSSSSPPSRNPVTDRIENNEVHSNGHSSDTPNDPEKTVRPPNPQTALIQDMRSAIEELEHILASQARMQRIVTERVPIRRTVLLDERERRSGTDRRRGGNVLRGLQTMVVEQRSGRDRRRRV